jgi:REP element-mobilizing transposase RayT
MSGVNPDPVVGGAAATPPDSGPRGRGTTRVGTGPGGTGPSRAGLGGTGASPSHPSRKRPVHLPNVERHNQPLIVFLTVCTKDRQPVLATPPMHALLVQAWQATRQWRVGNYLIMPDHVHLFCSPAVHEAENVSDWAAYWKGQVARAVRGCGPLAGKCGPRGSGSSRDCAVPGGAAATPPASSGPGGTGPSQIEIGAGGTAPSHPVVGSGGAAATPSRFLDVRDTLWQRDCWDTQLRDANHYGEKWQYVTMNPVRQRLAASPESWPFTGTLNELRW